MNLEDEVAEIQKRWSVEDTARKEAFSGKPKPDTRTPLEITVDQIRAQGREPGPNDLVGLHMASPDYVRVQLPWERADEDRAERESIIGYIRMNDRTGLMGRPSELALRRNPDLAQILEHRDDPSHPASQRHNRLLRRLHQA